MDSGTSINFPRSKKVIIHPEAFQGAQWQGYADELDHARDQWDR